MAANQTPPSRQTIGGGRLIAALNRTETSHNELLAEIATFVETIDGGEGGAGSEGNFTKSVAIYGFASAAEAKAAYGQLSAIRFAITRADNGNDNVAAYAQGFNRLRG